MKQAVNATSYQGHFMTPDPMDSTFEPLDDDLKMILGSRYEDCTHLFTPEARRHRRNNRLRFTLAVAAIAAVTVFFFLWAAKIGMVSLGASVLWVIVSTLAVGYNIGICVCKNRGYWGPMV